MAAVDEFGDVVRSNLPAHDPGGGTGSGSGSGSGSVVVDPDGLVDLAHSVIHDLHADAGEVRRKLRAVAGRDADLGPDEHAQRLGGVVAEALEVYLAWSSEIERLLLDFQQGMVAAAKEYTSADEAADAELRRRSTDAFTDRVEIPLDTDGDGRGRDG